MSDQPIELDQHRGLAAKKATNSRRDLLEAHLIAAPAASWEEAVEKARYVIGLYAASLGTSDTQHHALAAGVLGDIARLELEQPTRPAAGL